MQDLQKKIFSDYDITVRTYEDNHIKSIPDFLKKIDNITRGNDDSIIQLLDSDYLCGVKHLNQAIAQAIKAFNEGQNFANDRGLEICVRASTQKQISVAIKLLGIKNTGNITVVYVDTNDKQVEEVEKLLGQRNDALLEEYDNLKIRKAYDLPENEDIVDMINENIALLALRG